MVEAALTDAGCEASAIEIEVQPELEQPEPIVEEPRIEPSSTSAPDLQDCLGTRTTRTTVTVILIPTPSSLSTLSNRSSPVLVIGSHMQLP